MSKTTKASIKQRLQGLIAGTKKHTPSGQLTFGGASYPVADLIKQFQGLIDAIDAEVPARAAYRASVQAARNGQATVGPIITAYVDYLRALAGKDVTTLADYGLEPKKPSTTKSVDVKAAAAAKNRATRKLRGTRGKKQKADIKAGAQPTATKPA